MYIQFSINISGNTFPVDSIWVNPENFRNVYKAWDWIYTKVPADFSKSQKLNVTKILKRLAFTNNQMSNIEK